MHNAGDLPSPSDHHASPLRIALALAAGAAAGGVITSALHFLAARLGFCCAAEDRHLLALTVGAAVGSVIYVIGLLAVSPIWILLHRLGLRQWWVAIGMGSLVSPVALIALNAAISVMWQRPMDILRDATGLLLLAGVSATGGIVGFVIWRVAYTHARPSTLKGDNGR